MKTLCNVCCLLCLLLFCCRKPYTPPVVTAPNSYLVVEGVIDPGSDSTIIKLSKTVNLDAKVTLNPLAGATVTVEDNQSNTWPLTGDGAGNYVSPGLKLSPAQQYRLRINTGDGHQYLSDFVPVKSTPPIDSVGFKLDSNSVQLYVNTHDPANSTRYYRWDYEEAWKFHAKYFSNQILDTSNSSIVDRTEDQQVYYCFARDVSSNIVLASTTKLVNDVVYQNPLAKILFTSEKIEIRYSILVKQYALTADAYTFYTNLKKNTEQLGSIFDAQPSQLIGNIHSVTNAAEPVIGFLSVTNKQTKRIFISNSVIPITQPADPYSCEQDTALFADVENILLRPPYVYFPTIKAYDKKGNPIGWLYSRLICLDCTLRGSKTAPSFWK